MKNKLCLSGLFLSVFLIAQAQDFSKVPGVVVAHSPASLQIYLGSPSICIMPDGSYVASHDHFGPGSTEYSSGLTNIYRSDDKGISWTRISSIKGQYWSNLFVHKGQLYIMGPSKNYGDLVIRRSVDGGFTWTEPADGKSGLLLHGRYHTSTMPVVLHEGKLWRAMEDAMGPVKGWGKMFGSFMMSVPAEADLLNAENWTQSKVMRYDSTYLDGHFGGWLEGNAVADPDGNMLIILRTDYRVGGNEKASLIQISKDGKEASFDPVKGFIDFPGGCKKFTIRFDPRTKLYWTLANYVPPVFRSYNPERARNTQALCSSADLQSWKVHKIILQHPDTEKHGFQYLDWQFEGKDIIILSRTAFDDGLGGAHNQHDANFMTFHRVKNFRKYAGKWIDNFKNVRGY